MTASPLPTPELDALREAVGAGMPTAVADLGNLVRIPSVSWDGFDPGHVIASAEAAPRLTLKREKSLLRAGSA